MRSLSPRSMTSRGFSPSNTGFGIDSHSATWSFFITPERLLYRRRSSFNVRFAISPGFSPASHRATARRDDEVSCANPFWLIPNLLRRSTNCSWNSFGFRCTESARAAARFLPRGGDPTGFLLALRVVLTVTAIFYRLPYSILLDGTRRSSQIACTFASY